MSQPKANGTSMPKKPAEKAMSKANQDPPPLHVLWADVPEWQQDNHYILSHYRPVSNSFKRSFASLSYLHNESVNIYTHLLGALAFALLVLPIHRALATRYPSATKADLLAFTCFFTGAIACLGMSATYHTISNHSRAIAYAGNKLDYVGIVALIWGSFVPSVAYGFACEPSLVRTYVAMITTIGAGCGLVSADDRFRTSAWRPFRAGMFVAMGLSAVVPVLHGLKLYGLSRMVDLIGLPYVVTQGALYVLGAALYAARIPERFKPGAFDVWMSSHQIFHCLVLLAAGVHLVGLLRAFDYHHSSPYLERCRPFEH